ncbi:hypothetical protein AA984_06895 [Brevibacillus formosus]|uniref:Uncharacterized protein n=1 Tax=Brevibacillus formosus TaxID=54913 RepID=A0A837KS35_9BACL|nr:hypothetical protein AA984_06895 [Brevibacillus formosus]PSJ95910.1 hypothetical protein C7R91_14465 [Brevibacillus formosus]
MRHPPFLHPLLEREVGGEIFVYKKIQTKRPGLGVNMYPAFSSLLNLTHLNSAQLILCSQPAFAYYRKNEALSFHLW